MPLALSFPEGPQASFSPTILIRVNSVKPKSHIQHQNEADKNHVQQLNIEGYLEAVTGDKNQKGIQRVSDCQISSVQYLLYV